MWSGHYRVWNPASLLKEMDSTFQDGRQHDAGELLVFLMGWLHEDLNRVHEVCAPGSGFFWNVVLCLHPVDIQLCSKCPTTLHNPQNAVFTYPELSTTAEQGDLLVGYPGSGPNGSLIFNGGA